MTILRWGVVGALLLAGGIYGWLAFAPTGLAPAMADHEERGRLLREETRVTPSVALPLAPEGPDHAGPYPDDANIRQRLDYIFTEIGDSGGSAVTPAYLHTRWPGLLTGYVSENARLKTPALHAEADAFRPVLHKVLDEAEVAAAQGKEPVGPRLSLCIARACVEEQDDRARALLDYWLQRTTTDPELLVGPTARRDEYTPHLEQLLLHNARLLVLLAELPRLPEGFLEEVDSRLAEVAPSEELLQWLREEHVMKARADIVLYWEGGYWSSWRRSIQRYVQLPIELNKLHRMTAAWLASDDEQLWRHVRSVREKKMWSVAISTLFSRESHREAIPSSLEEVRWLREYHSLPRAEWRPKVLRLLNASARHYRDAGAWPKSIDDLAPRYLPAEFAANGDKWEADIDRNRSLPAVWGMELAPVPEPALKEAVMQFRMERRTDPNVLDDLRDYATEEQLAAWSIYFHPGTCPSFALEGESSPYSDVVYNRLFMTSPDKPQGEERLTVLTAESGPREVFQLNPVYNLWSETGHLLERQPK